MLAVQAMRDIVAKCLVKDAHKRPTAAQLLDHKFFKVHVNQAAHGPLPSAAEEAVCALSHALQMHACP